MIHRKPTHPGEVLKYDVLEPLNMTVTDAADHLGISRKALSGILNGHGRITPMMAIRIGLATKTSPESWLRMQEKLDLWEVQQYKVKVVAFA